MISIDSKLLDSVIAEAQASPRKRKNYNFHTDLSDTLQRMLNAMNPGTYVRPHKHEDPDKREAFIVLRGSVAVFEFSETGDVLQVEILNYAKGKYGVEFAARVWHSLVVLEPNTVVYEVKDGPYSAANDKNFAPWAPAEGGEGCDEYLAKLMKYIAS